MEKIERPNTSDPEYFGVQPNDEKYTPHLTLIVFMFGVIGFVFFIIYIRSQQHRAAEYEHVKKEGKIYMHTEVIRHTEAGMQYIIISCNGIASQPINITKDSVETAFYKQEVKQYGR
jgi:preprotein translocase subunit YajC